eukprot:TRINITY_DN5465_c0_g2_i4.p1 TRINITY_DN5465_c0_g2~~TRINITY_DN5465_c0_g2_i4.p1  ORF type:complete len:496 (+),score=107.86 TRINITY_DN5465_c0_g2_i4:44-1531(+)
MSLAGRSSALKDISVVELLSHLTSEYHRYERERNKWQTETTKLQLKIKHLEDERRIQVDINKDLVRRIKLLEFALRTERSKRPNVEQNGKGDDRCIDPKLPTLSAHDYLSKFMDAMSSVDAFQESSLESQLTGDESNSPSPSTDSIPSQSPSDSATPLSPATKISSGRNTPRAMSTDTRSRLLKEENDTPSGPMPIETPVVVAPAPVEKSPEQPPQVIPAQAQEEKPNKPEEIALKKSADHPTPKPVENDTSPEEFFNYLKTLSEPTSTNPREWILKSTLRCHLDSVRDIAFYAKEPALLSASEDHTIKLWTIKQNTIPGKRGSNSNDIEPIYTFRGHLGPVYSLAINHQANVFYSGGSDCVIRKWKMVPCSDEAYKPYGKATHNQIKHYSGHFDAIWDLIAVPNNNNVISASADGTVRVWNMEKEAALMSTFQYPKDGDEAYLPTSISLMPDNYNQVAVGYSCNSLAVVDLERNVAVFETHIEGNNAFRGMSIV